MKLARVVLLAPAILALGWFVTRGKGNEGVTAPVPWFALGFLALVLARSTGAVPTVVVDASRYLVPLMLAASVTALGFATDLRVVGSFGIRPLLLGVPCWKGSECSPPSRGDQFYRRKTCVTHCARRRQRPAHPRVPIAASRDGARIRLHRRITDHLRPELSKLDTQAGT